MKFGLKITIFVLIVIVCLFISTSITKPLNYEVPSNLREKQIFLGSINIDSVIFSSGKKRKTIKIGVIDTGVDLRHGFLKRYLKRGINVINPKESPMDDNGHGTSTIGVIASIFNYFELDEIDFRIKWGLCSRKI